MGCGRRLSLVVSLIATREGVQVVVVEEGVVAISPGKTLGGMEQKHFRIEFNSYTEGKYFRI